MRKNDSAPCTLPKAVAVCVTSPSEIVPAKYRGAWMRRGKTTAIWFTTRLKPWNFRLRKTIAQTLAITAAKRASSPALSTCSPR